MEASFPIFPCQISSLADWLLLQRALHSGGSIPIKIFSNQYRSLPTRPSEEKGAAAVAAASSRHGGARVAGTHRPRMQNFIAF
jgi:hypothetical protein